MLKTKGLGSLTFSNFYIVLYRQETKSGYWGRMSDVYTHTYGMKCASKFIQICKQMTIKIEGKTGISNKDKEANYFSEKLF